MERALPLLASAVAALGHLLFALAARRSGHPVPRAFGRVALTLSVWSAALFFHDLFAPHVGSELLWIIALALLPLGLELAAQIAQAGPQRLRLARFTWWIVLVAAVPLALIGDRAIDAAAWLLFPGLLVVLVALARAARARREPMRAFLVAALFAVVAALVDVLGLFEPLPQLPRLAGIGSVALVALLGSAVARHGLFELKPLFGRAAALAVAALVAAYPLVLVLERVDATPLRLVLVWFALLTLLLLRAPLARFLRSPSARERERRRRALLAHFEAQDEVLAQATSRAELGAELARSLTAPVDGDVRHAELLTVRPRRGGVEGTVVLAVKVGGVRLGWLRLELREPRLLEARVLRRALRRLAGRIAVALRAIEAQEERQRAQRLAQLGALAAGIAHEIKNPLGAILGALDLLDTPESRAGPDAEKWLSILRAEARRLDRVVTDALALGREPRLERQLQSPRAVAQAALLLASERAAAFRVTHSLVGGETVAPLALDGDQVRHALLNLLLNAIAVQPSGGRVELTLEANDRAIVWHVRDDGPGIPVEQQAQVFLPFFTTRPTGSGLGLAVAQRVALAHGGTLALAASDGGYRGAHFVLTIPIPVAADSTATPRGGAHVADAAAPPA